MSFQPVWSRSDVDRVIELREAGLTNLAIAGVMGKRKDAVAGLVTRLVHKGLIPRRRAPEVRKTQKPRAPRPPSNPVVVDWESSLPKRMAIWRRAQMAARAAREAMHAE